MKRTDRRFVAVVFLMIVMACETTFASAPGAASPGLTAQTSREGGVTVTVTPRNLVPGASSWDFEAVLETHTQPLDQDLTKAAALIDAQGKAHAPLAWEGSPPGGHHRRGRLHFEPLPGSPATVELRIFSVGGIDVRTFRWQLR